MLKKRNAQGLSITTIIIAVVALIVLVVLIAVFTGRIGGFTTGVKEAGGCGAVCTAAGYGAATSVEAGGKSHPGLVNSEGTACTCAK